MKTVIELNTGSQPTVMSYEEAFGDYGQEYSEARGNGRRRRQARKLERIANRREVKKARREARQANQQDRIEQRRMAMASRQNIKTERRRTAQERRNEQQQYRQGRKDYAKTARVNRRNIGNEEENYEDPNVDNTQTGATDDSQYDDTQMGGSEPSYDDSQDGGADYSQDGQDFDETSDMTPDDSYAEDTPDATEENDEDYGFDGELGGEFSHQESVPTDYIDIESMPIYKTALKVEQNKERIDQLKCMPQNADVVNEIQKRTTIISNLEGQMEEYSNANGKNKGNATLAKWKAQVKRLEHKNKDGKLSNRIASRKEAIARLEARINVAKDKRNKLTKVDPKLNASVKPNNIVVPPQTSNASGGDVELDIENNFNACGCSTGFDGGEFDMERGSFATGDSKPSVLSNVNWKGVGIGIGVSVLLIWGAEKMKLFGK